MAFEFVLYLVVVEYFDLGDEAVEAEADGGVGDVVGGGEVFEGAREEDEAFDEGEVFVFEEVDPAFGFGVVHGFIEARMRIILNNIKINFNFIDMGGF